MENTALAKPAAPVFEYMQLIQLAMEKSDLDKVEKMMELKAKHDAAEAKKAYDQALSLFKAEKPTIVRNKPGHNGKAYADLNEVVTKATPVLSTTPKNPVFQYGDVRRIGGTPITEVCPVAQCIGG